MARETRIIRYEPDDLHTDDLTEEWTEEFVEGLAREEIPEDARVESVEVTFEVDEPDRP